ncbi:glycosyltransferase family 4 protein [Allomesorhizobium alhagi]|jgi:glycosyltransferase involved in cell wall biosynthesis|uniref:Group 1 glycosyl transferase n=1 Tax=Mesorhizobium alhagi CCNWXJ12-2 TaxID=1107882 RepID=H0HIQ5_9HYPH|nr:group 1 glycosyl transferase [Mesorhizobium alhagi CCNWXJ12-2]
MLQGLTMPPRRILMTIDAVGGVWRYAMDLAAALRTEGVETVFAGLGPAPSADQQSEAMAIGTLEWLDAPLDWMARDESELDALPRLVARMADRRQIDLIHLNLPSQARGLEVSCPVVAVSHSCVVTWFQAVRGAPVPDGWAWQQGANRAGFDRADAVMAPSRSHADMLCACYGSLPRLTVVPNAVTDHSPAVTVTREDFVFAAGRWWDEGKNGEALGRAAAAMAWPLVVAGPTTGPAGQFVSMDGVRQIGEASNAKVRSLMAGAGIFVSPSLYEPFGLAALEAARSETPLVLSDIPTYRELWHGAALFADPHRPDAFADAVNLLAADEGLRMEMGAKALARSRRFTPEAQAAAVLRVYEAAAHSAFPLGVAV